MKWSPVTRFLLIANTGIHIFVVYNSVSDPSFMFQDFVNRWGLVPADFWHGAFYQPFTSLFLHGGWLHLAVNMLALWSLGTAIERTVGPVRFALLYLFSGLTGALLVVVLQSNLGYPTIGASGAIMGLLAAIAVFYPKSEMIVLFFPMKARSAALLLGVGSVLLAIFDHSSGISHLGHLGGLIGGILYTKFVLQLDFLRNDLHQEQGNVLRFKRRVDSRAGLEEELHRMMEQLQQERNGGSAQRTDGPSRESLSPEDAPKPVNEPFNEVIRDESPTQKRIYFDPETGRFYVK